MLLACLCLLVLTSYDRETSSCAPHSAPHSIVKEYEVRARDQWGRSKQQSDKLYRNIRVVRSDISNWVRGAELDNTRTRPNAPGDLIWDIWLLHSLPSCVPPPI